MHDVSIWDLIPKPEMGYNVRRSDLCEHIAAYFGKDSQGKFLLIIELQGDFTAKFKKDMFSLNGVALDLRTSERPDAQNLVLTLQIIEDRDIFQVLCNSLLSNLSLAKNMDLAYEIIFTHLRRWRDFLSGTKKRMLTIEQIRGLFAELECLKMLLESKKPSEYCIDSWTGPDRLQQDFMLENTVIEVKSTGVREKNTILISSENQLATIADKLYLMVYTLLESHDNSTGVTLNQQVSSVIAMLEKSSDRLQLESKLADYGLDEYDKYSFKIAESQAYDVSNDFPKLVRCSLANGIVRVSYEIELEEIQKFKCIIEI